MPRRLLSYPAFALAPAVLFGLTALALVGCTPHADAGSNDSTPVNAQATHPPFVPNPVAAPS